VTSRTRMSRAPRLAVSRVLTIVALLAVAVWLGGLIALGAVAAPVVFSTVPWPSSADAMSIVFRRFDAVAMACAAILLATEAARAVGGLAFSRADHARALVSLLAAAAAVVEGIKISPRIAALHAAGAIRGVDAPGVELARLHDWAERCGKMELLLLSVVIVLHVLTLTSGRAVLDKA
jgi:putative copper export protein